MTRSLNEEVQSLDLEENDLLYRIRRGSRIVWDEDWTTLTIYESPDGIESAVDKFIPHSLDIERLGFKHARHFNILGLEALSRISDRVARVMVDGETRVLKIARFEHEIGILELEVSIYARLASVDFSLAPKFIGYVYEEVETRVIGFLMEDVSGPTPGIEDLDACKETVGLLHDSGIIHRDLNKYNMFMTESGIKIFDFGHSAIQENMELEAEKEIITLAQNLQDESGTGERS
ncbi:uncharacterized protein N7459_006935 [Penicillium hispanicum]|uniref:uncharacterized protein n=1 Tax=Penicillium hispanicum TaxID=1080232 RepID=UPI00254183BC|nr:uncharacterized protein N7459_006935 [Penicillium hispanicum]KAJ5577971.1 hypothetical protein N7459_006935 [Penicillium hispanicum]